MLSKFLNGRRQFCDETLAGVTAWVAAYDARGTNPPSLSPPPPYPPRVWVWGGGEAHSHDEHTTGVETRDRYEAGDDQPLVPVVNVPRIPLQGAQMRQLLAANAVLKMFLQPGFGAAVGPVLKKIKR